MFISSRCLLLSSSLKTFLQSLSTSDIMLSTAELARTNGHGLGRHRLLSGLEPGGHARLVLAEDSAHGQVGVGTAAQLGGNVVNDGLTAPCTSACGRTAGASGETQQSSHTDPPWAWLVHSFVSRFPTQAHGRHRSRVAVRCNLFFTAAPSSLLCLAAWKPWTTWPLAAALFLF